MEGLLKGKHMTLNTRASYVSKSDSLGSANPENKTDKTTTIKTFSN